MTSSGESEQSTGELLQRLSDTVGTLLRQEFRQGKAELASKAQQSAAGAGLVAAGGVLGAAAVGTSTVTLVRLLDRVLPAPAAAAVATAALGGGAAALGMLGIRQLRAVNPVPEESIRSLRADVDAATGSDAGADPQT